MKAITILLFSILYYLTANGQIQNKFLFDKKKKLVDSLTEFFDSSQLYSSGFIKGAFESNSFLGEYFYFKNMKDSNEIAKINYHFENASLGNKTFYYFQNKMIKVSDNNKTYYCADWLYDNDGFKVEACLDSYLNRLEKEIKPLIKNLIR